MSGHCPVRGQVRPPPSFRGARDLHRPGPSNASPLLSLPPAAAKRRTGGQGKKPLFRGLVVVHNLRSTRPRSAGAEVLTPRDLASLLPRCCRDNWRCRMEECAQCGGIMPLAAVPDRLKPGSLSDFAISMACDDCTNRELFAGSTGRALGRRLRGTTTNMRIRSTLTCVSCGRGSESANFPLCATDSRSDAARELRHEMDFTPLGQAHDGPEEAVLPNWARHEVIRTFDLFRQRSRLMRSLRFLGGLVAVVISLAANSLAGQVYQPPAAMPRYPVPQPPAAYPPQVTWSSQPAYAPYGYAAATPAAQPYYFPPQSTYGNPTRNPT